jgi:hypothetical protein
MNRPTQNTLHRLFLLVLLIAIIAFWWIKDTPHPKTVPYKVDFDTTLDINVDTLHSEIR